MLINIKKYLFLVILILAYPTTLWAESETRTPLSYLTAMVDAHKKSSYELLYFLQKNGEVESFRLRHTFMNNKEYAQLLNLDHSREEIILKDKVVSYLGLDFHPFSLNSPHILDYLPNVIYSDYTALKGYAFLDSGKDRISDRLAKVVRLIPNDHFRYAYTLWIDEKTNLLLKSQLLDKKNNILEEFRVLQLYQSEELKMMATMIDSLLLPVLANTQKEKGQLTAHGKANWLPTGFKLMDKQVLNGKQYFVENENIDSYLYSDGLSTFNLYIMPSQGTNFNESYWQQGKMTVLNQTMKDKDIVIVGEIPIESAKEILKNIQILGEPTQ